MEFKCDKCGNCCSVIGKAIENKELLSEEFKKLLNDFPYKTDSNGRCEKLKDNICTVYDIRPDVCNIDKVFKKTNGVKHKDFLKQNKKMCQALKHCLCS